MAQLLAPTDIVRERREERLGSGYLVRQMKARAVVGRGEERPESEFRKKGTSWRKKVRKAKMLDGMEPKQRKY